MTSRTGRFLRFLAILAALYAVVGFLVLPPILKKQIEQRLGAELRRTVSVGQVRLNPFAWSVALERVEISGAEGAGSWLGWRRLYVNADPLKSVTGDWVLGQIALSGFHGDVEVAEDGALNFSDLIAKYSERAEEPREPSVFARPVRIGRLDVIDGHVNFSDQSHGEEFKTEVGPVNFTLREFRTEGSRGAAYRFEATSEAGEKLHWTGSLVAAPLTSVGDWRIENLQLPKYAPYLGERLQGEIVSGELTVSGAYEISLAQENRRLTLADGALLLKNLRVQERTNGPAVLELETVEIAGVKADAFARQVTVDTVRLNRGRAVVRREADGSINLLALLRPAGDVAPSAHTPSGGETRPSFGAKEISARDFELELQDLAAPSPVNVKLTRVEAELQAFTLEAGAPMPVKLAFAVEPGGTAQVAGTLTLDPLQAVLDAELAGVALTPFSPYLQERADVRVTRGTASLNGHATVEQSGGAPFSASFTGSARVEDLAIVDRAGGQELAGVAEFSLQDLKLATEPRLTVSLGELKLARPYVRAARREDGTLNFAALLSGKNEVTPAEAVGEVSAEPARPEIAVTRVTIQAGDFTFVDRSVEPAAELSLTQVNGALRNLSSLRPEIGDAELQARVNGTGPVRVLGRINPLVSAPFADLRLDLEAADLMPAGGYVGKYAGYELESGRLFLETRAKLADQKLDMQNSITLEQFALGPATESPDAVKLPIKLGIALLKDAQGRIAVEVPVQGSLADPQFQVGKVAGQVFSNLLTNAAKSPFAFIGSMFGGGGEELAQQEFLPGSTELTQESLRRIEVLQRALAARPALTLEIEAMADPGVDTPALKQEKLEELVRSEVGDQREGHPLTEEARARAVRQIYAQRFPLGVSWPTGLGEPVGALAASPIAAEQQPARSAAASTAAKAAEEDEEAEERGFFRRALDVATLKGPRDWLGSRGERKEREEAERRAAAERQAEETRQAAAGEAAARREQMAAAAPVPPLSLDDMTRTLADSIAVTPEDLNELAAARGRRVRELLVADGRVSVERVRLAEAPARVTAKTGARATLHLR